MEKVILSVGHSQHKTEYFIKMLKDHQVNYVLDVRSVPYSRFASDYNRENIKRLLLSRGIQYSFMGDFFGARPADKGLYSAEGYLDFEKVKRSSRFLEGFENVLKGMKQGNRIAFMCTEKDPINCHRAILVTRAFADAGIRVEHIMADNTVQTQEDLDRRLLDKYFPDRGQLSLFEFENRSEKEYLKLAYEKRNKEIGYSPENEKNAEEMQLHIKL